MEDDRKPAKGNGGVATATAPPSADAAATAPGATADKPAGKSEKAADKTPAPESAGKTGSAEASASASTGAADKSANRPEQTARGEQGGRPDRRLTYSGGSLVTIESEPDASGNFTKRVDVKPPAVPIPLPHPA